jgi:hypothetical protein
MYHRIFDKARISNNPSHATKEKTGMTKSYLPKKVRNRSWNERKL